jgi:hypothetical protein
VSIIAVVGGGLVLAWMRRHPVAEPDVAIALGDATPDDGPTPDESTDDVEHSREEPSA